MLTFILSFVFLNYYIIERKEKYFSYKASIIVYYISQLQCTSKRIALKVKLIKKETVFPL